jgi:hypothetical protein
VRKTTALLAAFAVLAALTACTSANTVAGCSPTVRSGDASSVITAPGKLDKAPKVAFPTPLYTKTTEKSTIFSGHGAAIGSGQPVVVDVTIINATDSTVLQKTSYTAAGGSLITSGKSDFPAVSKALVCAQVGSRIAVIGSPKDSHSGKADTANGIAKNDSFIYVLDVKSAFPAKADGAVHASKSGLPAVVTTASGRPGITIPKTAAPTKLTTDVLTQGSGAAVKKGHYIVVKYTGVAWTDKSTVFDSTWTTGQATVVQPGSTTLSPGLSTALVGQKVGSRLLVVIPAKLAASADGNGSAPAGETVVYVVDILGIAQ